MDYSKSTVNISKQIAIKNHGTVFKIIIILILGGIISGLVYFTWNLYLSMNEGNIGSNGDTNIPNSNELTTLSYTHPVLGYKVGYPKSWSLETEVARGNEYETFLVSSPNINFSENGIPVLVAGARFSVSAEPTPKSSGKEIFDNSSLTQELATDVSYITVADISAVKYSFSYESTAATNVLFVYDGVKYTVKFEYAENTNAKTEYADEFQALLDSFSFN